MINMQNFFYTDDITSPSKDRGKFIDESIDLVKKNIGYFSRKGFDFCLHLKRI